MHWQILVSFFPPWRKLINCVYLFGGMDRGSRQVEVRIMLLTLYFFMVSTFCVYMFFFFSNRVFWVIRGFKHIQLFPFIHMKSYVLCLRIQQRGRGNPGDPSPGINRKNATGNTDASPREICNRGTGCCLSMLLCYDKSYGLLWAPIVLGGGVFGRWLGQKRGVLMNSISSLIKKTPSWSTSWSTISSAG